MGKSRLAQEFCDQAGVPHLFFTAVRSTSPAQSVAAFLAALKESILPTDPELVVADAAGSWPDAFRVLASVLPDRPTIVVIDEVPWLAEQDAVFDGALQTAWDRLLSQRPVFLLLLGSDIHMMERLTAYDRPFYGRADNFPLRPLNLSDVSRATGLEAGDAIDAYLMSGGLPGILRRWPHGTPPMSFAQQECLDPGAPLFSVPESALLAEFPSPDQASRVFQAVGTGERTHANVAAALGNQQGALPSGTLSPLLHRLVEEKRVLAVDHPLSTRPSRPSLYRVADSNLRLYLAAGQQAQELSRRGRPEAAFRILQRRWASWRGKAVEPLIRESLELAAAAGELPWTDLSRVGGWWNRRFDPELDLVGADRDPVARHIHFVGSIKWLGTPFDNHDLAELTRDAPQVPGFTPGATGLVIVSLSGTAPNLDLDAVDLVWGPREIVSTWD